jgi:hypothetical protein
MATPRLEIGVRANLKDMFFDRTKVEKLVGERGAKFLNRVGGFIRTVARRSMRSGGKKRKASMPGDPPRYQTKDKVATLRNIQYGYEPARQSVVVGPVKLNQKQYLNGRLSSGTVPALHEFGGTAGMLEKEITAIIGRGAAGRDERGRYTQGAAIWGKKWVPVGRRRPKPGQRTRTRVAKYPARPFMAPALVEAQKKFPQLWYGSVSAAA